MGSATSSSNKTKKERPRYKNNIVKSSAQLQFTNLSQETPLIKISNNSIYSMDPKSTNVGSSSHNAPNNHIVDASDVIDGRIYETRWQEYVGSELIFDDYGELVGKVKEHLTCKENVKFVPTKSQDKDKENAGGDHGRANGESSFLKKAIKLATDLEKIR
ncbi:TFC7 [Candida oxycetoniae]|uniref:TFC7 n=1 Tax=Candida oxycetoniae TaxID=497107 RepID=A0AAI9T091_9ASCO|nr:TFC7 [Candida oxycetoniae]KAI3406456.2 TFC7 [Candida oxycetoniae]